MYNKQSCFGRVQQLADRGATARREEQQLDKMGAVAHSERSSPKSNKQDFKSFNAYGY